MGPVLALASAITFGVSDLTGGLAAMRAAADYTQGCTPRSARGWMRPRAAIGTVVASGGEGDRRGAPGALPADVAVAARRRARHLLRHRRPDEHRDAPSRVPGARRPGRPAARPARRSAKRSAAVRVSCQWLKRNPLLVSMAHAISSSACLRASFAASGVDASSLSRLERHQQHLLTQENMARIAQALSGEVIADLHERLVKMAQEQGVVRGRRMRVDTTVVETNIHYPTDSSLLGDSARVITRTMKKIQQQAGSKLRRKVRDRTRSVNKRVIAIATASRHKGPDGEEKRKKQYRELLRLSRQILNDAKRVIGEVDQMPRRNKRPRQLSEGLASMTGRVRQVVKQAKARVFDGLTQLPGKIVSLFEPHTEIIRKGKASKPTEFGKMVKLQEAENQIVTDYEVYDRRPSDANLLMPAIAIHHARLGRLPRQPLRLITFSTSISRTRSKRSSWLYEQSRD